MIAISIVEFVIIIREYQTKEEVDDKSFLSISKGKLQNYFKCD